MADLESEWRHRQQGFDDDEKCTNKYLKLFRNEEVVWVVEQFSGLNAKHREDSEEVEESVAWSDCAAAWVAALVRRLT